MNISSKYPNDLIRVLIQSNSQLTLKGSSDLNNRGLLHKRVKGGRGGERDVTAVTRSVDHVSG